MNVIYQCQGIDSLKFFGTLIFKKWKKFYQYEIVCKSVKDPAS